MTDPVEATTVVCPLCSTPIAAGGTRCPMCNMARGNGLPNPFTVRWWAAYIGLVAVSAALIAAGVVLTR